MSNQCRSNPDKTVFLAKYQLKEEYITKPQSGSIIYKSTFALLPLDTTVRLCISPSDGEKQRSMSHF